MPVLLGLTRIKSDTTCFHRKERYSSDAKGSLSIGKGRTARHVRRTGYTFDNGEVASSSAVSRLCPIIFRRRTSNNSSIFYSIINLIADLHLDVCSSHNLIPLLLCTLLIILDCYFLIMHIQCWAQRFLY